MCSKYIYYFLLRKFSGNVLQFAKMQLKKNFINTICLFILVGCNNKRYNHSKPNFIYNFGDRFTFPVYTSNLSPNPIYNAGYSIINSSIKYSCFELS